MKASWFAGCRAGSPSQMTVSQGSWECSSLGTQLCKNRPGDHNTGWGQWLCLHVSDHTSASPFCVPKNCLQCGSSSFIIEVQSERCLEHHLCAGHRAWCWGCRHGRCLAQLQFRGRGKWFCRTLWDCVMSPGWRSSEGSPPSEHICVACKPDWGRGAPGRLPGGRVVCPGSWGLYVWRSEWGVLQENKQRLAKLGGKRKCVLFEELEFWWDRSIVRVWGVLVSSESEGWSRTRTMKDLTFLLKNLDFDPRAINVKLLRNMYFYVLSSLLTYLFYQINFYIKVIHVCCKNLK